MIQQLVELTPNKTYKTRENAIKAVDKFFADRVGAYKAQGLTANLTYFLHTHTDGRFFPVFVGERALHAGLHFHFNVVA